VEKAQIPVTKASGARSYCLAINVTLFVLSLGKPDTLATCTTARSSKINWKTNSINMIYQINSFNVPCLGLLFLAPEKNGSLMAPAKGFNSVAPGHGGGPTSNKQVGHRWSSCTAGLPNGSGSRPCAV